VLTTGKRSTADLRGRLQHRALNSGSVNKACDGSYLRTCSGSDLRLVWANSSSCASLMDSYISFDAPLSSLTLTSPRLAARAAPAASCWALDRAGISASLADGTGRSNDPAGRTVPLDGLEHPPIDEIGRAGRIGRL